jgi:hypothetical protein
MDTKMKNNTKIIISVVVALVFLGGIYLVSKKQMDDSVQAPVTDNIDSKNATEVIAKENVVSPTPIIQTQQKVSTRPVPSAISPSLDMVKYSGEFFPFEFKYPASFRLAKNIAASTSDHESKSYNFNRLATDGGVAGYVSFYIEADNDSKYKDLLKAYPDKYSIVEINGYKFYKLVEISDNSNKEVRIEYITFKEGVKYRFALVAVNGDRKALDITAYQNELTIMDMIVKSLKIN